MVLEGLAPISGVILAAGASRRFGGDLPKQLFPIDHEPMVRRTARVGLRSALDELVLVVGHQAKAVRAVLDGLNLRIVNCDDYALGQSRSVIAGLRAISPNSRAALFLLVDQPFVGADLINRLIECFHASGAPIVVPSFQGRRGTPVLFSRSVFPELLDIQGDIGGRQLFPRYESRIVEVPLNHPAPLVDVDTPADVVQGPQN